MDQTDDQPDVAAMMAQLSNTPPEELPSKTPKRAPKAPKAPKPPKTRATSQDVKRVTRATSQDVEQEDREASPAPPLGMELLGLMSPILGGSNALQNFLMAPQNDTESTHAGDNQDGQFYTLLSGLTNIYNELSSKASSLELKLRAAESENKTLKEENARLKKVFSEVRNSMDQAI
ncbi:unnamed protein product [Caenorhabditis brenneri]